MNDSLVAFFQEHEHKTWDPEMGPVERERFGKFLGSAIMHQHFDSGEVWDFFNWIRNESTETSVRLNLDVPWEEMYQEGLALYPHSVGHRGSSHDGWKSICLHGIDYDKTNDIHKYGYESHDEAPYKWTVASAAAPVATKFFQDVFPFESFLRVRFMYLEPGGYILPHNDNPKPGMGAINIALNNPVGCDMVIENKGRIPWQPGEVRFLDVHNTHAVWNRTDELRIHMIAHAKDWGNRAEDFAWSVIEGYLRRNM